MRVNISYSVELEDVLDNIRALYTRENLKLKDKIDEVNKVLSEQYYEQGIGELVFSIKEYREAMSEMDLKLNEIVGILRGYQQIKENESPLKEENETQAEE